MLKDKYCGFTDMSEVPGVVKFIETENRMVVARDCGREEWEEPLLLNGYRVSTQEDEECWG